MKRRLFIQSALGAFFIPAAGELFAKTPVIADIELPKPENVISKFGFVTDVHYVVAPTRLIPKEDSVRVYRDSLAKLRQAIDLFNGQNLDFAIELGDFKDCNDNGTREGTIAYLQTVEAEFRRFNGPRYHVTTTSTRLPTATLFQTSQTTVTPTAGCTTALCRAA